MRLLSRRMEPDCTNLSLRLHFSFNFLARILKLALACAYIAILLYIGSLINPASTRRPCKYMKVQLIRRCTLLTGNCVTCMQTPVLSIMFTEFSSIVRGLFFFLQCTLSLIKQNLQYQIFLYTIYIDTYCNYLSMLSLRIFRHLS